MPLPTARHALPHVGAAGAERPGVATCAHPQIGGLLRRGQPQKRSVGDAARIGVQRRDLRGVSEAIASPSCQRQTAGAHCGQRAVPPFAYARAITAKISPHTHVTLSSTIQPKFEPHRAGVEACAPLGYPQSIFRRTRRTHRCGLRTVRPMATAQCRVAKIMLHYLRRYV